MHYFERAYPMSLTPGQLRGVTKKYGPHNILKGIVVTRQRGITKTPQAYALGVAKKLKAQETEGMLFREEESH